MLVMVQVTEVGVPVPTETVPEVKLLPVLASLALKRPKVTPEAMVAIAPMEAATPTARAMRFLDSFMIVILCCFVSGRWRAGGWSVGHGLLGWRAYRSSGPTRKNRAIEAASRPRTTGRCMSARM